LHDIATATDDDEIARRPGPPFIQWARPGTASPAPRILLFNSALRLGAGLLAATLA
jgi:hypothetical protein